MGRKVGVGQKQYFHSVCSFSLYCECSFCVFIPDIWTFSLYSLYLFHIQIRFIFSYHIFIYSLYSNYIQALTLPNSLLWTKLKRAFFDRFPYLLPEAYLEPSLTSMMEPFCGNSQLVKTGKYFGRKSYIVYVRLGPKYATDLHSNK